MLNLNKYIRPTNLPKGKSKPSSNLVIFSCEPSSMVNIRMFVTLFSFVFGSLMDNSKRRLEKQQYQCFHGETI